MSCFQQRKEIVILCRTLCNEFENVRLMTIPSYSRTVSQKRKQVIKSLNTTTHVILF